MLPGQAFSLLTDLRCPERIGAIRGNNKTTCGAVEAPQEDRFREAATTSGYRANGACRESRARGAFIRPDTRP